MNRIFILFVLYTVVFHCLAKQSASMDRKYKVAQDTLTDYQVLTDSAIKYAFGYACSVSGMPPKGRRAIDHLVKNKDYAAIRSVLDGQNNEGKIYAIEALLILNANKEIELTDNDKKKIRSIIESNIFIVTCEGCLFSRSPSMTLFQEAEYKKLLKKNGIEIPAKG